MVNPLDIERHWRPTGGAEGEEPGLDPEVQSDRVAEGQSGRPTAERAGFVDGRAPCPPGWTEARGARASRPRKSVIA